MKVVYFLVMIFYFSYSANLNSQELPQSTEGTFQIVQSDTKVKYIAHSENLNALIEANRDDLTEVFVQLRSSVWIRILSRAEINNPEFQPLENKTVYWTIGQIKELERR